MMQEYLDTQFQKRKREDDEEGQEKKRQRGQQEIKEIPDNEWEDCKKEMDEMLNDYLKKKEKEGDEFFEQVTLSDFMDNFSDLVDKFSLGDAQSIWDRANEVGDSWDSFTESDDESCEHHIIRKSYSPQLLKGSVRYRTMPDMSMPRRKTRDLFLDDSRCTRLCAVVSESLNGVPIVDVTMRYMMEAIM